MAKSKNELCWSYLLHLGFNMWLEENNPAYMNDGNPIEKGNDYVVASRKLRFDMDTYNTIIDALCDAGINTVVLDLGEGVQYKSHPEISAEGAWSVDFLKSELAKLRARGITPIPKLNFAATHDEWMGVYSRMVSTDIYYKVCSDLIAEVCEIFDHPSYFHIGMDEEDYECQSENVYVVMRQGELWWHDLNFLIDECKKNGADAIMWSDMGRYYEDFEDRISKNVIQNNWYYWNYWLDMDCNFDNPIASSELPEKRLERYTKFLNLFGRFEKAGIKQMPAGSTWNNKYNMSNLVKFSKHVISEENLAGFMQTLWEPTVADRLDKHLECIANMKLAIDKYDEIDEK